MNKEILVFNKVNSRFNYSQAQIARWWDKDPSGVNRFIKGKTDLPTSEFIRLISSMPVDFQNEYWKEFLEELEVKVDLTNNWEEIIAKATRNDLAAIFLAVAKRCYSGELDEKEFARKVLAS
ncbi:MAG: hypothetical protein QNJ54_29325 [Prochloraceae cyanobacterium]|nr:hypothetical protein [Prochloraceae cyanobacterium]